MLKPATLSLVIAGGLASGNAVAQEPISIAEDPSFEVFKTAVGDDVKNRLWTNLLSVADQAFSGDNQQVGLDFQDDVYRLTFDLGAKRKVYPGIRQVTFTTFSLKGSVPVSGTNSRTSLPTLNELSNGSTIELQFSRTQVPLNKSVWDQTRFAQWKVDTKKQIIDSFESGSASDTCKATAAGFYLIINGIDGKTADETLEIVNQMSEAAKLDVYDSVFDAGNFDWGQMLHADAGLVETCAPGVFSRHWEQQINSAWREEDRGSPGWIKTFGVGAKVGQEDFNFKDSMTFQDMQVSETTYAFNAFARFERGTDLGGQSLVASIELQHAFNENDSSTMCQDPDDMATCVEAVFGPPQAEDRFVAKVSYSRVLGFNLVGNKPVALSLNANYNIDDNIWGLEAPVFLYRDDKNLGAGIRGGWRSDTDNFEVGFFVSQKFSL